MMKSIMSANDITLNLIDINDYESYFRIYNQIENLKYLDFIPFDDVKEAKEMILKLHFNDLYESYCYKIIYDDKIVGFIDIFNILNHEAEVAFILDLRYQKQNIMYKSLILALNCLKKVEINKVCAKILEGNLKSINLCKRLGFIEKEKKIINFKGENQNLITFYKEL